MRNLIYLEIIGSGVLGAIIAALLIRDMGGSLLQAAIIFLVFLFVGVGAIMIKYDF